MWDTNSLWFDVAIVMGVFALGNILFGHFEEHKPKWRRILKVVIVLTLIAKSSQHENAKQPHWAQARSSCWGTRSPLL